MGSKMPPESLQSFWSSTTAKAWSRAGGLPPSHPPALTLPIYFLSLASLLEGDPLRALWAHLLATDFPRIPIVSGRAVPRPPGPSAPCCRTRQVMGEDELPFLPWSNQPLGAADPPQPGSLPHEPPPGFLRKPPPPPSTLNAQSQESSWGETESRVSGAPQATGSGLPALWIRRADHGPRAALLVPSVCFLYILLAKDCKIVT